MPRSRTQDPFRASRNRSYPVPPRCARMARPGPSRFPIRIQVAGFGPVGRNWARYASGRIANPRVLISSRPRPRAATSRRRILRSSGNTATTSKLVTSGEFALTRAGQQVDPRVDPTPPVRPREPVEQPRADQGRVRVEHPAVDASRRPPVYRRAVAIDVGPGRPRGQARGPAADPGRRPVAKPDRRLLALAAQADDLDLEAGPPKWAAKSLAGPSLIAPPRCVRTQSSSATSPGRNTRPGSSSCATTRRGGRGRCGSRLGPGWRNPPPPR